MDKTTVQKAIVELKKNSKKRKFSQSFDLIVCLQDLNMKNPDDQVEFFAPLHYEFGKKIRICAFTGPELHEQAKIACDMTVPQANFGDYSNKVKAKKLAAEYDYFIAQANIMPKVAGAFGRVLGPRGKMPNPKAGCIVPGNANLKPLAERLQKTVKVTAKKIPVVQLLVGKENQAEEEVIDNITTLYQAIIHHLPKEKNNIKNIYLKLTMSKPIKLM
ncbi:MAG: 50S ribosomal protein L1 [Nanoarchaeota archaeon]|nr:50S ribosomal protein L1 [Nanoarchaeota archaeon]